MEPKSWRELVRELGVARALRSLMATELGEGDSVEFYRQLRAGKSVDEIHAEILRAKAEGKI